MPIKKEKRTTRVTTLTTCTHRLDAHEVVLGLPGFDLINVGLDARAHGIDDASEEELDLLGLAQTGHALSDSIHAGDVDTLQLVQAESLGDSRLVGLAPVDQVALEVSCVVGAAGRARRTISVRP